MAEILGLLVPDQPPLRQKVGAAVGLFQRLMDKGWADKPHLKNPDNWPQPMREAWGDDRGVRYATAIHLHLIEQFRKISAAIRDFNPDFIVVLYRERDDGVWGNWARPRYVIEAHEALTTTFFQPLGRRENYWGKDPDRVDTLLGHRSGALYLVRALQDAGFDPLYTLEPFNPTNAMARLNLRALAPSFEWDKPEFKWPVVPIAVDPFGFNRTLKADGLSEWDRSTPRPLLPKENFELGRNIARIYRNSPWRVALVAGVDWSHMRNCAESKERFYPDVEADARRYEQWKNNEFSKWGENWTFEEMEDHAQWEIGIAIILAGAMTELGSKIAHSDFTPTWICSENCITSIFEIK